MKRLRKWITRCLFGLSGRLFFIKVLIFPVNFLAGLPYLLFSYKSYLSYSSKNKTKKGEKEFEKEII